MVKTLTESWMLAVLGLWVVMLGLLLQTGFFEVASVGVALAVVGVINAGFSLMQLLVEARCAMQLQPSAASVRLVHFFKVFFMTYFTAIHISLIATSRTSLFNTAMFTWLGSAVISIALVPGFIIFYDNKLITLLQDVIVQVEGNRTGPMDEKPALIQRLKLFRFMVSLLPLFIIPTFIAIMIVFSVFKTFPFMYLVLVTDFQVLGVVGLLLERLTLMIQTFQDAKEQRLMDQSHSQTIVTPPHSILLFQAHENSFVFVLQKHHLVGHDTFFKYLFSRRIALLISKVAAWNSSFIFIFILGSISVILSYLILITGDTLVSSLKVAIFLFSVTVPFFMVPVFSVLSLKMLFVSLSQAPSFQLRFVLIFICFFSFMDALLYDIRSAMLTILCFTSMFTFILDLLTKEKEVYLKLVFLLSTTVPFFTWFLLSFDYLSQPRRNAVLNGRFSWYHFAMDFNGVLVWCAFLDGVFLMKHGLQVFIHISSPIKVRYANFNLELDNSCREGETDLKKVVVRRSSSTQSSGYNNIQSPQNPLQRRKKVKIVKTFVNQILIRERDSFAYRLLPVSLFAKLLDFNKNHALLIQLVSSILVGVNLLVWISLVLTGVIDERFTLLNILGILPIGYRTLLKSQVLVIYLVKRIEFFFDFAIATVLICFLGISLIGNQYSFLTIIPLVLLWLTYLDWRTSDALIQPKVNHPFHITSFLPILTSVFLLPIFAYSGLISFDFEKNFVLVPPHVTNFTIAPNEDVFLLYDPPSSVFSRIRYSQAALDVLLAYGIKLLLDFLQRLRILRYDASMISLTYIRCPISPQYCDFDETRPDFVRLVWDYDRRTLDDAQKSLVSTGASNHKRVEEESDDILSPKSPIVLDEKELVAKIDEIDE